MPPRRIQPRRGQTLDENLGPNQQLQQESCSTPNTEDEEMESNQPDPLASPPPGLSRQDIMMNSIREMLEPRTRSRSRHRTRVTVGRATESNPSEPHLQQRDASENPAGIFPSVEIRDGSVASLASKTRLSARVKDPETLDDGVNPSFEVWTLLVEG
ncbi:uncharacterized protein EAE98_006713 [Botrytis deweyae]|uniref:Uncharacterized protein n=1 Tax=Botrytis deweyae TaxID=2478750 RepID=A0ABQ7IKX1_9HELO|nr:uncharacterized protein EAE98_006713 [Botrytis deweyae]KAF7926418.1 hypothetical protein EAE98_006713 [Botrytis deweyae]